MGIHPMERLLRFLFYCECCWDGCDCGCLMECPQRRNHAAYAQVTGSSERESDG